MPIKPENKARYPDNWKAISKRIREEADQKCEWCAKPNGQVIRCMSPGLWVDPDSNWWRDNQGWKLPYDTAPSLDEGRDVKIVLTVAHLNHKPEDCRRENLRALCQSCHLTYDAPHHAKTRRETKRKVEQKNQTELFDAEKNNKSDTR